MNHAINTQVSSAQPVHVACAVCMKEVPLSEAIVPEAKDYVAHFCSPDCYQKWQMQNAAMPLDKPAGR
jgi:hypothetical protein